MDVQIHIPNPLPPETHAILTNRTNFVERQDGFYSREFDVGFLGINMDNFNQKLPNIPFSLVLVGKESGGGVTTDSDYGSYATIICSPDGERLKPFAIGPRANGPHAIFFSRTSLVEISACFFHFDTGPYYTIAIVQYNINHNTVNKTVLWDGEISAPSAFTMQQITDVIPEQYAKFIPAIVAGMTKGNCYHCRHAHYYAT